MTTITGAGLAVLDAAWEIITTHPEVHEQGIWFDPVGYWSSEFIDWDKLRSIVGEDVKITPTCGTTACLAGWIAACDGKTMHYAEANLAQVEVNLGDGNSESIGSWAADLIGIPDETDFEYDDEWRYVRNRGLKHLFTGTIKLPAMKQWVDAIHLAYDEGIPTSQALALIIDREGRA